MIIDVMGDTFPTDQEITDWVVASIRAQYTADDETKTLRAYLATPTDPTAAATFATYNAFVEGIRAEAAQNRLDVAAGRAALEYEGAQWVMTNPPGITAEDTARAQAVIAGVTQATLDLVAARAANR